MRWNRRVSLRSCHTNERTATDKDGDVAGSENLIAGNKATRNVRMGSSLISLNH